MVNIVIIGSGSIAFSRHINDISEFRFNTVKEAMGHVFGTINESKKVEIL